MDLNLFPKHLNLWFWKNFKKAFLYVGEICELSLNPQIHRFGIAAMSYLEQD